MGTKTIVFVTMVASFAFLLILQKCTNFMVNFTDKNGNYGFFFLIKEVAKMAQVGSMVETDVLSISNLDAKCFRCLCEAATHCNLTIGCQGGYCGPFWVSQIYWTDAGRIILPDDDVNRNRAFQDCALSYQCSIRMITGYLAKFGRDCNGDGITNCYDFSMINFNGAFHCKLPLRRNSDGAAWQYRFERCFNK